jgi:hypothetical protein
MYKDKDGNVIVTVTRTQKLVTKVHIDKGHTYRQGMKELRELAIEEAKFQIINNQNMDLNASSETYKAE